VTKINVSDIPVTSSEMMNRDHKEFIKLLAHLIETVNNSNNSEKDIDAELDQLRQHTAQHFSAEEALMVKTNFPPYAIHKGEHDRILTTFDESIANWKLERDREALKNLIEDDLPDWFIHHVSIMDSVTAQFFDSTDII